ncbi:hypothetical protein F5Y18DRAFT_404350 [Xylariaceae sp. FL1019]|nr:hypothetical protein F5Y18DRAFT_404350 [Xylariaceae sp. FL1019]
MRSSYILLSFGTAMSGTHAAPQVSPVQHTVTGSISSCQNASIIPGTSWVKAICPPVISAHSLVFNYMDLNHCFVNSNGDLIAQAEGNFAQSCENLDTSDDNSAILTADCYTTATTTKPNTFDLNDIVKMDGDVLKCFDWIACSNSVAGPGGDCAGKPSYS